MTYRWVNSSIGDDPEGTLATFQSGLTVDLIATKRADFETCAEDETLSSLVERNRDNKFDFLPVTKTAPTEARKPASIIGLIEIAPFMHAAKPLGLVGDMMQPLSEGNLLGGDASILLFIRDADHQKCRLIVSGHEISGLVCLSDLQRLPVRAALFGLVTCLEMIMTNVIRPDFGGESWLEFLSEGRRQKLQAEIAKAWNSDNLVNSLLFTQFADKTTIIRKSTTFALGDKSLQNEFREIQVLRDRLAHANDYAAKADDATKVCRVVRSIDKWIKNFSDRLHLLNLASE